MKKLSRRAARICRIEMQALCSPATLRGGQKAACALMSAYWMTPASSRPARMRSRELAAGKLGIPWATSPVIAPRRTAERAMVAPLTAQGPRRTSRAALQLRAKLFAASDVNGLPGRPRRWMPQSSLRPTTAVQLAPTGRMKGVVSGRRKATGKRPGVVHEVPDRIMRTLVCRQAGPITATWLFDRNASKRT